MDTGIIILIVALGVCCGLPCLMITTIIGWVNYLKSASPRPLKFADKRAVVRCLCGECEIELRNWVPRMRGECMCYDCT